MALSRNPPAAVLRVLRQEVGFRCPVPGCGLPYLTWHHFDPPWRVEHHHRPEGMIALCAVHAAHADGGAFTDDQLRELKRTGSSSADAISDEFSWMRQRLMAVVGGVFFYEVNPLLQLGNKKIVWFNRNENNELLLNFSMPTESGVPRAQIEDNVWTVPPDAADLICRLRGKELEVHYDDGVRFRVKFDNYDTKAEFLDKYPTFNAEFIDPEYVGCPEGFAFPLTVVELWQKSGPNAILDISPSGITLPGGFHLGGGSFVSEGAGILSLAYPLGLYENRVEGQHVRLVDLLGEHTSILYRTRIVNSELEGPAILSLHDAELRNPTFASGMTRANALWRYPSPEFTGAVAAVQCLFEDCTFNGIGIAVDDTRYGVIAPYLPGPA